MTYQSIAAPAFHRTQKTLAQPTFLALLHFWLLGEHPGVTPHEYSYSLKRVSLRRFMSAAEADKLIEDQFEK